MHLLGVDIGTTGCKATVFDLEGNVLGYGFQEYDVLYSQPGWAEQDPRQVWQCTKTVIRQAVHSSGGKEIKALSLSVQGDAVIPVDKRLAPLHNALLGMDYRSYPQAQYCEQLIGSKRLFEITGMRSHPLNSLTKILWFKEYRPDIYKAAWKFTTYADFILALLGAELVIDYTMASRTMAFALDQLWWSKEILESLDVNPQVLSRPVPSGEVVGTLSPQVAQELGLTTQVKLVSGGHDQACAALGAGAVTRGIAINSTGTAEVISTTLEYPLLNEVMYDAFYPCYCYVKKGMYFTFALNHVGGILLRWYRDNFGQREIMEAQRQGLDPYDLIVNSVPEGPSSIMVLPHFNGSGTPVCDIQSKGAILGLTLATTKHDIVKAILEGLTYEMKINLETMEKAGISIRELRAVGGGAKSPVWLQVKADITGYPVLTLKSMEAACLGAALLAGTAIGAYPSLEEGVKATVKVKEVYEPRAPYVQQYQEKYQTYKAIYPTLKALNKRF